MHWREPRRLPLVIGPAFVAAVAYVDPGNVATNASAGARHGTLLVWVIVLANLMAMPVQYLAAKLGVATGKSLPHLCRDRLPRALVAVLWPVCEIVIMATDVAEVVGGALALYLLTGLPPLLGGLATAAVSLGLLAVERGHRRRLDVVITAFLGLIGVGFGYQAVTAGVPPAEVLQGLRPRLAGTDTMLLAVGIVGATVMPHAVFVHSALAAGRAGELERRTAVRLTRVDVLLALGLAGAVNLSVLVFAVGLGDRVPDGASLADIHAALGAASGAVPAAVFALALLASGVSSTTVGAYAGQVVLAGFTDWRLPPTVRRAISLLPALVVLALGLDTTTALVVSQVVLSFGIPCALLPLVWFTARHDVMGPLVNRPALTWVAGGVAGVVVALNAGLVLDVLGVLGG